MIFAICYIAILGQFIYFLNQWKQHQRMMYFYLIAHSLFYRQIKIKIKILNSISRESVSNSKCKKRNVLVGAEDINTEILSVTVKSSP